MSTEEDATRGATSEGGRDGASRTSEGSGPLLDPAAFVRLREWGGDELLRKMIELFIENSPRRMEQIREGVEAGDPRRIEDGAHALKSSCGNLGAESVRGLAARMEVRGEEGNVDAARDLLPELEVRYDETLRALTRARDRGASQEEPGEAP